MSFKFQASTGSANVPLNKLVVKSVDFFQPAIRCKM